MTVRFLHNFPARNMLRVVWQNRKMALVMSILMILSGPLIIGARMNELLYRNSINYNDASELYLLIGAVCLVAAVLMGMFCAICSFTETHKKARVDMLYSLPLTGTQRFFTDYLGGAFMYILPYLITVILGWIIIGIGCPFINPIRDETLWSVVGETVRFYAMGSVGLFVLMLFYYTLSVLITVCCGTLFESICTNILLNGLIPGTAAAFLFLIDNHTDMSFDYLWHILGFFSPVGGLIYCAYLIVENNTVVPAYLRDSYWDTLRGQEIQSHNLMPNYFRWILVTVLLTIILLMAAWQLYIRRKAEHVGKPFVYVGVYYLTITLLIMLLLCLLELEIIGPVLLITSIVYFVCEVIRKRGFKRFWLSVVSYVVTVVMTVGFFWFTGITGCFGRISYVPAAANIKSVKVEFLQKPRMHLEFNDPAVISKLVEFHKTIISRSKTDSDGCRVLNQKLHDEFPYEVHYNANTYDTENPYYAFPVHVGSASDSSQTAYHSDYNYFTAPLQFRLTYYTKTGTVIYREPRCNADEMCELENILRNSDLFRQTVVSNLNHLMELELNNEFNTQYNTLVKSKSSKTKSTTLQFTINNGTAVQTRTISAKDDNIEKLCNAYAHDLERMSEEERMTAPLYCSFETTDSLYKVYESYTETISLLETWGFHRFSVPERYSFIDAKNPNNAVAENNNLLAIRIYAPEQWSTDSLKYPNSSLSQYNNTYVKGDTQSLHYAYEDQIPLFEYNPLSLKAYYPELYALLDAAQKEYISEAPCYCIFVNGVRYIVPPAHNDLVTAVVSKHNFYGANHLNEYFEAEY